MYLQIHILATGNWNFRDFLVICMSIALLDDQFFYTKKSKTENTRLKNYMTTLVNLIIYSAVIFGTVVLYKMKILENWTISSEIGKIETILLFSMHFKSNKLIESFFFSLMF